MRESIDAAFTWNDGLLMDLASRPHNLASVWIFRASCTFAPSHSPTWQDDADDDEDADMDFDWRAKGFG